MTKEIPSDEWMSFLDSFSLQHQGWLVTVEVIAPEIGAQEEASNLPLEGITSSESNEHKSISISVGNQPSNHLTHTVNAPIRLWLKQTAQGADEALEIESTDGVKTLLRFRSAMPAEMVDGLI
jgi:hypothetical protein